MFRILIAIIAALAVSGLWAQDASTPTGVPVPSAPVGEAFTSEATACCDVVAGTVLSLEILDLLNSSQRKRGDKFGLRVVTALVVNGVEVIPAGTTGVGEVVHAAAARGGGAPGELLIAARSLEIDGQTVPLRGLKLGVTGVDNSAVALGVSMAAGPFAFFIRGREIEIPANTRVEVKVARTFHPLPAHTAANP